MDKAERLRAEYRSIEKELGARAIVLRKTLLALDVGKTYGFVDAEAKVPLGEKVPCELLGEQVLLHQNRPGFGVSFTEDEAQNHPLAQRQMPRWPRPDGSV